MTNLKSSASKIEMTSLDDLFGQHDHQEAVLTNSPVKEIELRKLHTFEHHPFFVKDDEAMDELVMSVKHRGVLEPGICRQIPGQEAYEIISGHRRKRASELAGLTAMPMYVVEMDHDEAIEAMVDANLHRPHISLKEKAAAYRMKHDALVHQGKIANETTAESIGKKYGESERTIRRIIRLSYLTPELLQLVEDNQISQLAGGDLSYLQQEEMNQLYLSLQDVPKDISTMQAKQLRKLSEDHNFTKDEIQRILLPKTEDGKGLSSDVKKKNSITLKFTIEELASYFGNDLDAVQIKSVIIDLLNHWTKE